MRIFEKIGKFFTTPDRLAHDSVDEAIQKLCSREVAETCRELNETPLTFVKQLGGENGSARLLTSVESGLQVVIKTYEPVADAHTGEIIANRNRLELVQHEVAVFLISQVLPLTKVPETTLRIPTEEEKTAWKLNETGMYPNILPSEQAIMVQKYISDTIPFTISKERLIDKIGIFGIFSQVIFDYLIAYDDGRFNPNFLITENDIWAIDHGNCFLYDGAIRTEAMGIYDNLVLDDSSQLLKIINSANIELLITELKKILGEKKTEGFMKRLNRIKTYLKENSRLDLNALKQEINESHRTLRQQKRWNT